MDKELDILMKQFDDKIKECEKNNDEKGVLQLYNMLNKLQQNFRKALQ